jgi:hypothetical protein
MASGAVLPRDRNRAAPPALLDGCRGRFPCPSTNRGSRQAVARLNVVIAFRPLKQGHPALDVKLDLCPFKQGLETEPRPGSAIPARCTRPCFLVKDSLTMNRDKSCTGETGRMVTSFGPRNELMLHTRKGRQIPNEILPEKADFILRESIQMMAERFPRISLRSVSNCYNCVGMVFASRRTSVHPQHIRQVLSDDGFRKLDAESQADRGDVVLYFSDDMDEPAHVGIVIAKDVTAKDDFLYVLSKWGFGGEYVHLSKDVPTVYGMPTEYWTDRRLV